MPGVNTQGKTMKEVKENLKEALQLILEANRFLILQEAATTELVREPITLSLHETRKTPTPHLSRRVYSAP